MSSVTLDDGGWGSIIGNFGKALYPDAADRAKMMLAGAHYRKTELETEEQRRKMEALRRSIENFPNTLPSEVTLPGAGGAEEFGPPRPEVQQAYTTQRNQRIADNAAATLLAKSASDYAQGVHANRGMGAIAAGIPVDPRQQDVIQTQISSIGGSLPNYSATPHTYQPTDASGAPIGAPITSRRLPEGPAAIASPVKIGPTDHFGSKAAREKRLFDLSQKAARDPASMSIPELEEAAVHIQELHPVENQVIEGAYGKRTIVPIRKSPMPAPYTPLIQKVDELNRWKEWSAGGRVGPPPAAPSGVGVGPTGPALPDATVGGLAGGVVGGPPAAAGGAPGPGAVAPAAALPLTSNVGAPSVVMPPQPHQARADWRNLDEVKKFVKANADYDSIRQNMMVDSAAADIAIIYGLAKILDPESVVMQGELVKFSNTGSRFEYLNGYLAKALNGESALDKPTRARLADMAYKRMDGLHSQYDRIAKTTEQRMTDEGFKPGEVVDRFDPPKPVDIDNISRIKPRLPGEGIVPPPSVAAPATAARPTTEPPPVDHNEVRRRLGLPPL
jgi:hypothetical protein